MKTIKKYKFFIFAFFLLTGMTLITSMAITERRSENSREIKQKSLLTDNEALHTIEESTVLILICIGMIGLLGIRRAKNHHSLKTGDPSTRKQERDPNDAQGNQHLL